MIYVIITIGTLGILMLIAIFGSIELIRKDIAEIKLKEFKVIVELHEKQTNTIGLN